MIKPQINYYGHSFSVFSNKNGERHQMPIHRLVAMIYLRNEDNLPIVRHIDGDPSNISVSNLEWSTNKDAAIKTVKAGRCVNAKRVEKVDLQGNVLKTYVSLAEAALEHDVSAPTIAYSCAGKRSNLHKEFRFRFV